MNRVLITGANGFVGASLCKKYAEKNIDVIAVVRSKESDVSRISELSNISIVYCDLEHIGELPNLIDGRVDVFYHFAWQGTSGPQRGDLDVQLSNVKATCDAVKASSHLGCKKFIYAASIMEYEIYKMISTDKNVGINSLYSSSKLAADFMAKAMAEQYGVQYIRVIISNIYGPGEYSARLINTSIRKLINNEHCAFSPGEQLYDFIYISDAVQAFYLLGYDGRQKTYYLGSSNPRPLKDFLYEMRNQVNPSLDIGIGEIPFNGVSLSYDEFDIDALRMDTGFVPEIAFSEGIRKTAEWIMEDDN